MLSFLVRYNIYIGLAAVSVATLSEFRFVGDVSADPWYGFLFFSSAWLYNFSQYFSNSMREKAIISFSDALNRGINFMLGIKGWLPAMLSLPFLFMLDLYRLWPLLPAILISVLYSFPFRAPGKGAVRLRDLMILKGAMIAVVWAILTVIIPLSPHLSLTDHKLWIHFFERATFIFALALGADLFDMQWEKSLGLETLAHRIGRKGMLKLINIGMVFSAVSIITLFILGEKEHPIALTLLLMSCPFSSLLITRLHYGLDEINDYLIIDGLIILQGLIYLPCMMSFC